MRASRAIHLAAWAVALLVPAHASATVNVIGLRAGLSISTLHGSLPTDFAVENGWKLGFGAGVLMGIPLAGGLSLQPELNFVAKGTSLGSIELTDSSGIAIGNAEILQTLGYLEVPVLARVTLPAGYISPYLLAGPVLGIRVSQRIRIKGDYSLSTSIDYFRRLDLGVVGGAGLELGRGPVRAIIEGRYTRGLTPAAKDTYSSSARNGDILVSMGVAIYR